MFGKPEWFKPKTFGWGLQPVTKQGWIYTGVWLGVLLVPFLPLLVLKGVLLACVWLVFGIAALSWDVWDILRQMKQEKEDENLVHIRDDDDSATLATRKYEMELRD